MPCDTCSLGHVARRYRWQQSFDPMTSLNLTLDAGQLKVRSRSGQIVKSIFLNKKHTFLAQNFLRLPSMLSVLFFGTIRRTSVNHKSKNGVTNFSLYITNTFLIRNIGFVCGNCISIQSSHKVV